jgi:hypothetical protein
MYVGSVGIQLSGTRVFVGIPKWAMDNNKATITTETNVLSIKNCTSYNGVTNRSLIRFNMFSFSSTAGNGVCTFRAKRGVTLGGSPSYTTINGTSADQGVTITSGNSIASYDVAGTTVANGDYVFGMTVANPAAGWADVTPYDFFLAPGEIATFTMSTSQSAATCGVAIAWIEDI